MDNANISHNLYDGKIRTKDVLLDKQIRFESLLLREEIQSGLRKNGFTYLSPIQRHSLPLSLTGCSIIVHAKCGTGKTLIFAISSLYSILLRLHHNLQCILLAPTREIAAQNAEVINKIGCDIEDMNLACCIGGRSVDDDMKAMDKCQIVVGTPGRINHLIELGGFKTSAVRLLVLDEVDQLFSETIAALVMKIVSHLPPQKQIIACCATLSSKTYGMLCKITNDFKYVSQNGVGKFGESRAPNVLIGLKHYIAPVLSDSTSVNTLTKRNKLLEILKNTPYNQCFVFVNYITQAGSICNFLNNNGIYAKCISSNQDQATRLEVMNCLKNNTCHVLVTTDLASRGVDIYNANLVVNMSIPYPPICYLHRIGRAGRFGSQGNVVTILYEGREVNFFLKLVSSVITELVDVYILPTVINRNITGMNCKPCSLTPNPSIELNSDMPSCWKNLIKNLNFNEDDDNNNFEVKGTTFDKHNGSVEDGKRVSSNKKNRKKTTNNNNKKPNINNHNNNNNNVNDIVANIEEKSDDIALLVTNDAFREDGNEEIKTNNNNKSTDEDVANNLKRFIESYKLSVVDNSDICDSEFIDKFKRYIDDDYTMATVGNRSSTLLDEQSMYQSIFDEMFRRNELFENLKLDFDSEVLLRAVKENCVFDLSADSTGGNELDDGTLNLGIIIRNVIEKMEELVQNSAVNNNGELCTQRENMSSAITEQPLVSLESGVDDEQQVDGINSKETGNNNNNISSVEKTDSRNQEDGSTDTTTVVSVNCGNDSDSKSSALNITSSVANKITSCNLAYNNNNNNNNLDAGGSTLKENDTCTRAFVCSNKNVIKETDDCLLPSAPQMEYDTKRNVQDDTVVKNVPKFSNGCANSSIKKTFVDTRDVFSFKSEVCNVAREHRRSDDNYFPVSSDRYSGENLKSGKVVRPRNKLLSERTTTGNDWTKITSINNNDRTDRRRNAYDKVQLKTEPANSISGCYRFKIPNARTYGCYNNSGSSSVPTSVSRSKKKSVDDLKNTDTITQSYDDGVNWPVIWNSHLNYINYHVRSTTK